LGGRVTEIGAVGVNGIALYQVLHDARKDK
jgi:hypothetical protein